MMTQETKFSLEFTKVGSTESIKDLEPQDIVTVYLVVNWLADSPPIIIKPTAQNLTKDGKMISNIPGTEIRETKAPGVERITLGTFSVHEHAESFRILVEVWNDTGDRKSDKKTYKGNQLFKVKARSAHL